MSRFISPVEIAKRICVLNGDTSMSHMGRVMVAVGQAVTDVYENAIPQVRSEFVKIGDNLTAPMPSGCAKVIKVGALNDHAQIIHLYEDNRLRRNKANELAEKAAECDFEAGFITKPIPVEYTAPSEWFHGVDHNVGTYGELYGYRFDRASIGTWRANEVDGMIEFGSGPLVGAGRWVLVEFKDMGEGRFATVPSEAVSAIMARARYHLSGGGNSGMGHIRDFQREYAQYKRLVLRKDILEYLRPFGADRHYPNYVTSGTGGTVSASDVVSTTGGSTGGTTPEPVILNYYDDDADAIANGLKPGDEYYLTDITQNNYSLPGGLRKVVYDGP